MGNYFFKGKRNHSCLSKKGKFTEKENFTLSFLYFKTNIYDVVLFTKQYDGSIQGRNRNYRNPAERSISHQSSIIGQRQSGLGASRNPHDLLHQSGAALSVQERNAIQMLEGFFGQ